MLFDMVEVGVASTGSFASCESALVSKIDACIPDGLGDVDYQKLFTVTMRERCACSSQPRIRTDGPAFVDRVSRLVGLLLQYRSASVAEVSDDRASCMLNLVEFYKQSGFTDLCVRYVFKLRDLHVKSKFYSEAGHALSIYASMLSWTDTVLPALRADNSYDLFPKQAEWERKADVYVSAIRLFKQGGSWRSAIKLNKELARLVSE